MKFNRCMLMAIVLLTPLVFAASVECQKPLACFILHAVAVDTFDAKAELVVESHGILQEESLKLLATKDAPLNMSFEFEFSGLPLELELTVWETMSNTSVVNIKTQVDQKHAKVVGFRYNSSLINFDGLIAEIKLPISAVSLQIKLKGDLQKGTYNCEVHLLNASYKGIAEASEGELLFQIWPITAIDPCSINITITKGNLIVYQLLGTFENGLISAINKTFIDNTISVSRVSSDVRVSDISFAIFAPLASMEFKPSAFSGFAVTFEVLRSTLSLTILDESTSNPLADAEIKIIQNGRLLLTTKSNEQGTAEIQLKPGNYTVQVTKQGYSNYTSPIDIWGYSTLTIRLSKPFSWVDALIRTLKANAIPIFATVVFIAVASAVIIELRRRRKQR